MRKSTCGFIVVGRPKTRDDYAELKMALLKLKPDESILIGLDEFGGKKPPKCIRLVGGRPLRTRKGPDGIRLWLL